MSNIQVNSIASVNGSDPVSFPTGISGDTSNLTFEPKVLQFSPIPLSTDVAVSSDIVVTFNQKIQFSGVGTIFIREGSATGIVTESFTCGVSAGATIVGETLIINPTSNLSVGTTYYVTLPSVGIANTFGQFYKGTNSYLFRTVQETFSAQGGTYVYTLNSPTSPTSFYKYHIFTSSGILTTSSSSVNANDLQFMMIAGGGGGGTNSSPYNRGAGGGAGGLITRTGPTLVLSAGTYTVTIGAGGGAGPTQTPPSPYTPPQGGNTKLSSSPTVDILSATGGGGGGGIGSPGGSGGGSWPPPGNPQPGGAGVPGQGNPGGGGSRPGPEIGNSGGGGGAGAAGSPTGPGGNGSPNPAFTSSIFSGYIPTPVLPADTLTAIGPTGLYAGGGGGNGPTAVGGGGQGFAPGGTGGGAGGPYLIGPNQRRAQANTGGGGAGAPNDQIMRRGASGVVMIRYAVPASQ